MGKILIIGGTGYTGANVAAEAAARGHQVASYARSAPKSPVEGVSYTQGAAEDAVRLVPGRDAVVAALSPRGASPTTWIWPRSCSAQNQR